MLRGCYENRMVIGDKGVMHLMKEEKGLKWE